jgi:hypothetical protein
MIGKYRLMAKKISLHRLDHVELQERTAVCSSCGPISIVVQADSKHPDRAPRLYCINRYRETVRECQRRRREKERLQNPNWKPKHKLTEIDSKKMRANCSLCGPTDILKAITFHNLTYYRCATQIRKQARDYSRLHYKSKS